MFNLNKIFTKKIKKKPLKFLEICFQSPRQKTKIKTSLKFNKTIKKHSKQNKKKVKNKSKTHKKDKLDIQNTNKSKLKFY